MNDIYSLHQIIGLVLASIVLFFWVWQKLSLPVALAVNYTIARGVFPIQNSIHSVEALLSIFIIVGFIATASIKTTVTTLWLCTLVVLINTIIVICNGYGIFNAGSFDNTILVLMVPLIFLGHRKLGTSVAVVIGIVGIVTAVAVLKTQGSTPYMVLAAIFVTYYLAQKKWDMIWHFVIAAILALVAGFLFEGRAFLDSNGRGEQWVMFMKSWRENVNVWIGTGTGTFFWVGPNIQGGDKNLFTFMHNEYLQALFEQGIVGLAFYTVAFIYTVYLSRHRPWLVATFGGLAVAMLTQFPFRFFLSQLIIMLFVRVAHEKKS